jgi:hypothetical protein
MAWLRDSRRLLEICDNVIELKGEQRDAYIERVCANDPALRESVRELLRAIEDSGSFLSLSGFGCRIPNVSETDVTD